MKKGLLVLLTVGVVLKGGLAVFPVQAAVGFSTDVCPADRIPAVVYAQDAAGIVNDFAIINDRTGNRLVTVKQRHDDFVVWPASFVVPVRAGESLVYQGGQHVHSLSFDVLDDIHAVVQRFNHQNPPRSGASAAATVTIASDGFIRFNAGEYAHEYNLLVLCKKPQAALAVVNNQPVNQPPVWSQTPNQTVAVGQTLQFSVFASDPNNDPLTYNALNLPAGASFNPANRVFSWMPVSNQAGSYTAAFLVSDGVNSADMNVFITVVNQGCLYGCNPNPCGSGTGSCFNQPPVWSQLPVQTGYVGQVLQFTVSATDPDGDYLSYSALNLPYNALFSPATRVFSWLPTISQAGTYTVTFRVTDSSHPADMNVAITVLSGGFSYPCLYQYGSHCPVSSYSSPYQYQYSSSYPCAYQNITSGCTAASPYQYNYPNYNYSNIAYANPYPYSSCYGYQPIFTSPQPTIRAREGQLYTYTVQAAGGVNCPATYRLVSAPEGMTIDRNFGVIVWVPNFTQGRLEPYPVTVAAGNGTAEATQTFYVIVDNINQPPVYLPPTYTPPTYQPPTYQPPVEKLKISNVRVQQRENGDVWTYWETNKPAASRVIFDIVSRAEQTKNFTYANATPEDTGLTTGHAVNMGNLAVGQTYYLRAISKNNGELAASAELSFVKLPCPVCAPAVPATAAIQYGGSGGTTGMGLAAALAVIGGYLFSPWLLLLIIVVLLIVVIRSYRQQKISVQGSSASGPF